MGPLALTMGDPAGIGGDVTLAAWASRHLDLPPFFVIDDPERLSDLAKQLNLTVPIEPIANPAATSGVFRKGLPVLPLTTPLAKPVVPGRADVDNAPAVVGAIDQAVDLVRTGQASAMVTNPIHKATLQTAGFSHPGHTEYLGHLAGGDVTAIMMLAIEDLRVVPVTVHMALRDVPSRLATDDIVTCSRVLHRALTDDFGITAPRLAVAALNPHAGESGAFGREEIEIITPAIDRLSAYGISVTGPLPADTLFHPEARAAYDAVVCMYHDQALVPIKTLDFYGGVNVTLGLPWVRTSPDHGTAFGLAGTGVARCDSLCAALFMAGEIAARRSAED